jgi:hypothetical protein
VNTPRAYDFQEVWALRVKNLTDFELVEVCYERIGRRDVCLGLPEQRGGRGVSGFHSHALQRQASTDRIHRRQRRRLGMTGGNINLEIYSLGDALAWNESSCLALCARQVGAPVHFLMDDIPSSDIKSSWVMASRQGLP